LTASRLRPASSCLLLFAGGGNQTSFPNAGGTHSCSKESYRCPPKSVSDPTPSYPCDGDTAEFAFNGTYAGPQFEPHGGYPGKYASEGIYTVRARPGRLSAVSISHSRSVLYGALVWARRALNATAQHGGCRPRQYGFGNNQGQNAGGQHLFVIVDLVQVPQHLDPGLYVLSHRYDCEQTTQVWCVLFAS
jgi:hypothetical protein